MAGRVSTLAAAAVYGTSALRKSATRRQDAYTPYDGQSLVQLSPGSTAEIQGMFDQLDALGCTELADRGAKKLMAICSAEAASRLAEVYATMEVVNTNAGAFYRELSGEAVETDSPAAAAAAPASRWYGEWQNHEAREARLRAAVAQSGGACVLEQVGTSLEGRPISAVVLTGRGWQAGMPRMVADFQLHAREWITGMAGLYAVEQACQRAASQSGWPAGAQIVLIPNANPDGFIYSETTKRFHRKNMRTNGNSTCIGVDLNRNWDPDWRGRYSASTNPCSDTFVGSAAFSEPETLAVKAAIDAAPVSIHLDVHSYGNLIIAPWSFTYDTHPQRPQIDEVGLAMQRAIKAKTRVTYKYGGSEVLYPASGVCPDYSTARGAYGFTYELRPAQNDWGGGGFAPPANQILPTAEECWAGILAAIEWSQGAPPPTTPPPTPVPPPTPAPKCVAGIGEEPNEKWDCTCEPDTYCFENGSRGCPWSGRGTSTRYFWPSCTDCACKDWDA